MTCSCLSARVAASQSSGLHVIKNIDDNYFASDENMCFSFPVRIKERQECEACRQPSIHGYLARMCSDLALLRQTWLRYLCNVCRPIFVIAYIPIDRWANISSNEDKQTLVRAQALQFFADTST
jgi:hypothetical protein